MDYSTFTLDIPCDADGFLIEVGSLFARLERLTDQRDRRGVRYPLAVVMAVFLLAKLSGEDTPAGVAAWARLRQVWLARVFHLPRARMPRATTFTRVFERGVKLEELQAAVSEFLQATPAAQVGLVIALDGKRLRGSIPAGQTRGVYLLAAYLPEAGVVLMQVEIGDRENELSAAPRVLELLDLQGKIVTGDAMFTQRALSAQIVAAGGDYLWPVKDNQLHVRQAIEQLWQPEVYVKGFSPAPSDFRTARTLDKGHGRMEERTLTTSSLLNDYLDWPDVGQVFRLERRFTELKTHRTMQEVAYGLTSLTADEADPARLLQLVRTHWGIENGLHYRRDRTLHEDALRMTRPQVAQVVATIHNLIVGLGARSGLSNLAQARRYFNAHSDHALSWLFGFEPTLQ